MYGGLKKSASRLALVAAAGAMSTSAFAADLGGDCCADLEERVAELEATTARKGTRKNSLEIYGQVNQAVTGWSDGGRWNATLGYMNHSSSTRFGFRGSSKISPSASAGYSMVIDVADKARTSTFSQAQDIGGSKMAGGGATRAGDDYTIRLRDANWWLESSVLGRITMGRITSELVTGSPDIAGILHAVGDDVGCNGGGLQFRDSGTGFLSGRAIGSYSANCGGPWANRLQGLKWQSPTLAGFQAIATYGGNLRLETGSVDTTAANAANAGQEYGIGARYAGEFGGIRLAANAGAQWDRFNRDLSVVYANGDAIGTTGPTSSSLDFSSSDTRTIDLAAALMHVQSGFFVSGDWTRVSINAQNPGTGASGIAPTTAGSRDATRWNVRAGIGQNWFGLGKTTVYGEYMRHDNFRYANNPYTTNTTLCTGLGTASGGAGFVGGTGACDGATAAAVNAKVGKALSTFTAGAPSGDSMRVWGLGFNQAIDAAAMDLYVNYRNYNATDATIANGLKGVSIVTTGARIRF